MKIKRTLFFIILFLMIGILAICLNFYMRHKVDEQTIVGEIVHVRYTEVDKYDECLIYIKPKSDIERNDWVLFKVTKETEGLSESETKILSESPEIKVGNVVEIAFDGNSVNRDGYIRLEAISIRQASNNTKITDELSLVASNKYSFDQGDINTDIIGEVVHVAKVNIPDREGYILYIDDRSKSVALTEVWIDGKTLMDDETAKMLFEGSTGYEVVVKPINAFPFDSYAKNIYTALSITITTSHTGTIDL